jgi:hypothetical protein
VRHVPTLLAICAAVIASGSFAVVANAQSSSLPPTNMGKYVHQPGDNQYLAPAQMERHRPTPVYVPPPMQQGGGGGGGMQMGYERVRPPFKADPTLEAISSDEPVIAAGFPPMPDRADLPVESGWGGGGGWGAGGGGGGGAAPGGPPMPTSVHQHYNHYDAGAFAPPKPAATSSGHQGYDHAAPPSAQAGPTHGGYNHAGASSDFYSSSGGSPAQQALNALGKEPKLNGRADQGITPEAPMPVSVKQATTQDLSLPDDEFSTKTGNQPKQPSAGGQMLKQMGRNLLQPVNQVGSMGGSMAGRFIHF